MGKEEEIKTTDALVKSILAEYPKARNSDNYLYIRVVKALNPQACDRPFEMVLSNLMDLGLPCFETVSRCRRKLQAEHPELWSDAQIKKYRENAEKDFEDYARS